MREGGLISLTVSHDDDTFWFTAREDTPTPPDGTYPPTKKARRAPAAPVCACGSHVGMSRRRWWQLDESWRVDLVQAWCREALHQVGKEHAGCIVTVGDGPLAPVCALAVDGDRDVVSVQSSGLLQALTRQWCQEARSPDASSSCRVVAVAEESDLAATALDIAMTRPVAAFLLEPHLACTEESPLQTLAALLDVCRALRPLLQPALEGGAALVPGYARIYGAVVSCEDLWRVHQPVGRVQGIDMSAANAMRGGVEWETREIPLWQHHHTVLTSPMLLAELSLAAAPTERLSIEMQAHVVSLEDSTHGSPEQSCHAVALWVEYDICEEEEDKSSLAKELAPPSRSCWNIGDLKPGLAPVSTATHDVAFFPECITVSPGDPVVLTLLIDLAGGGARAGCRTGHHPAA